jgi:2-polyprenyl-3-methyl-5-hydroxy-6-metoxy-1,4-benzoquinol methylase
MTEAVDYFSNHQLKLRFPWRLYHAPIVRELGRVLGASPNADVLNVGSGPFLELKELDDNGARLAVCDIDPRAIEVAKELHGSRLARADVIEPGKPLPHQKDSFDVIVTMDVIEHVPEPQPWVDDLARVLRPGGKIFLTTPNYGFSTLGILERTALEAIARYQGFSRKDLHPSKFSRGRLKKTLERAGFTDIEIERISFGWVLAATATKKR